MDRNPLVDLDHVFYNANYIYLEQKILYTFTGSDLSAVILWMAGRRGYKTVRFQPSIIRGLA